MISSGYFTKAVFRFAIVLCVFVWLFALGSNGWRLSGEVRVCPLTSHRGCVTEFFDPPCSSDNPLCKPSRVERLLPGEFVGVPESGFSRNSIWYVLGIIFGAFGINHLLFVYRKRSVTK